MKRQHNHVIPSAEPFQQTSLYGRMKKLQFRKLSSLSPSAFCDSPCLTLILLYCPLYTSFLFIFIILFSSINLFRFLSLYLYHLLSSLKGMACWRHYGECLMGEDEPFSSSLLTLLPSRHLSHLPYPSIISLWPEQLHIICLFPAMSSEIINSILEMWP